MHKEDYERPGNSMATTSILNTMANIFRRRRAHDSFASLRLSIVDSAPR